MMPERIHNWIDRAWQESLRTNENTEHDRMLGNKMGYE